MVFLLQLHRQVIPHLHLRRESLPESAFAWIYISRCASLQPVSSFPIHAMRRVQAMGLKIGWIALLNNKIKCGIFGSHFYFYVGLTDYDSAFIHAAIRNMGMPDVLWAVQLHR